MKWTIKSIAGSRRHLLISHAIIIGSAVFMIIVITWAAWDFIQLDPLPYKATVIAAIIFTLYNLLSTQQKTVYSYRIYSNQAKLVYYLHYPKYAKAFFKGIALLGIFISLLIGLMTGSLLFLLGPGAIAFIAALRLLTWKNPIKRETSLPWHEYNFVTVDRKRRFIVTHVSDLTLGFEARLPDDALFEQYLAFLHSVLPATAQFTEKEWDMSLI